MYLFKIVLTPDSHDKYIKKKTHSMGGGESKCGPIRVTMYKTSREVSFDVLYSFGYNTDIDVVPNYTTVQKERNGYSPVVKLRDNDCSKLC